jgi:small nuclear ribonucleoprotein (snRNP)-like protein
LIDCFEVGANRAAIVMCWLLAVDHLYSYVLKHHLRAFNAVLAKNTDRRVRVSVVQTKDDFGDIPEGKLIEFLRSANIISNDVRKILEEKLGTRNTSAHPSAVAIKPSKVVEFIDDLVENVVLKYVI